MSIVTLGTIAEKRYIRLRVGGSTGMERQMSRGCRALELTSTPLRAESFFA